VRQEKFIFLGRIWSDFVPFSPNWWGATRRRLPAAKSSIAMSLGLFCPLSISLPSLLSLSPF
jgi:hypothetical protein